MDPRVKDKRKGRIIVQVSVLFALCILMTGLVTYLSQLKISQGYVAGSMESYAENTATEVAMALKEYPAYQWLVSYWHEHADELEIDYDEIFAPDSGTKEKEVRLAMHHPELRLRYATIGEVVNLDEEDQKLYAEITYSWLITRINEIKAVNKVDYLFCVQTKAPYTHQFFLFSAADPGAERGTEYEQVYPLGVTSEVSQSQQQAMSSAVQHKSHFADAGNYVDYYLYMDSVNGYDLLIGFTYDETDIYSNIENRTKKESLLTMGYEVFLALIILVGIFLLVLNPLRKVQENIRLYKDTKDSKRISNNLKAINLNNEIGELAADVTDLTEDIDEYLSRIQTITAEKERIGTELALGKRIQEASLPHEFPPFPDRHEFDIYASMQPAREVGGDFYDYFFVDDDHICLVIADVSGKGIPGALFMMISKNILKSYAKLGLSPSEALAKMNNSICADNSADMFVTVWIGVLELSTGKLIAANAGHEYPALKEPDGVFELVKDKHGLVIGGMEDIKYSEYELILKHGSKLFLYTDGVPEATDADNVMFGTDRMIEALNSDPDADPEHILFNVQDHIDAFLKGAEQFDDLTMLCIEFK